MWDMEVKVKIKWKFGKEEGIAIDKFGYPEFNPENKKDVNLFWYEEGSGSCDCNRAIITGLNKRHSELCDKSGSFPCGNKIEFLEINVMRK